MQLAYGRQQRTWPCNQTTSSTDRRGDEKTIRADSFSADPQNVPCNRCTSGIQHKPLQTTLSVGKWHSTPLLACSLAVSYNSWKALAVLALQLSRCFTLRSRSASSIFSVSVLRTSDGGALNKKKQKISSNYSNKTKKTEGIPGEKNNHPYLFSPVHHCCTACRSSQKSGRARPARTVAKPKKSSSPWFEPIPEE